MSYKCDVCQKEFAQRFTLTIHKRTHTREIICLWHL